MFTTPNVFPPAGFEQADADGDARAPRGDRAAALLRLQASATSRSTTSTTSSARRAATSTTRKRSRDRRPARPRRAAHRRAREDRLPGRDQAAARRRAPDRHHALPARRRGPLRAASPTSRTGPTGSRSSASTCATRRASRRSASTCSRPASGSTSSSTTPARPCGGRPTSTGTCSRPRRRRPSTMPARVRAAARRLRGPAPRRHPAGGRAATPLAAGRRHARSAELSQVPLLRTISRAGATCSPRAALDQDLQQVDLRDRNSWRLLLAEVPSVELLEAQLVNAVAPFVLNARLKPLMLRTPERDKHIVNVSAVEGQFYRRFKTNRHPHTNMAKAALNMMTRTSAADYQADGIHMNSVDTGWVTDEDPLEHRRAEDRRAPLPPAARHRRRRRADRRSDHRRLQHRRARLGQVPQGLPPDRLVDPAALGLRRAPWKNCGDPY